MSSNKKKYPFWHLAPHTFILGAGASRAAFPDGDKHGNQLPLMRDFIDVVGLKPFLERNSIEIQDGNIETIYSSLVGNNAPEAIIEELNTTISEYFRCLEIPDHVTLYDELILSLQAKDAIFSFNWDPLLLQAFHRNNNMRKLPRLYFLHGNVENGICVEHKRVGFIGNVCSVCRKPFQPGRLLYPIKEKDYTSDPYIKGEWEALRWYVSNSFILSIFGYSAPSTDVEAVEILKKAWTESNEHKRFNEMDIIDVIDRETMDENWAEFVYNGHRRRYHSVRDTISFNYARRSCESWGDAILQSSAWRENNLPQYENLGDLQAWVTPLIDEEIEARESEKNLIDSKRS
jgi:hypothetical protein